MLTKPSDWSVVLLSLVVAACADAGSEPCYDGTDCASNPDDAPLLAEGPQADPSLDVIYAVYAVASGGHIQAQASGPMDCKEITDARFPKLERSDCLVPFGTTLTLDAQPAPGSQFDFWLCGDVRRTDNPITFADVTENTKIACQAVFVPIPTQPPSANVVVTGVAGEGGSVTLSTTHGSCAAASCSVPQGADVTLQATANFGAIFTGWSGCSTSRSDTLKLASVRSNQVCTATFLRFF